jgi:hypothetical protein
MSFVEHELLQIAAGSAAGSLQHMGNLLPSALSAGEATFVMRALRMKATSRLLLMGNVQLPWSRDGLKRAPGAIVQFGLEQPRPHETGTDGEQERVLGSQRCFPFGSGTFSAAAELGGSSILSAESDEESIELLFGLARLLRPGGRYLCGRTEPQAAGAHVSADKRRIDEWRREPQGIQHHTMRLIRKDGSWQRLHERSRVRDLAQVQRLLERGGFSLLNAFRGYTQQAEEQRAPEPTILLCQRD